ncbi:MAG: bifunctional UDP-N-acetylglucosamine diphosphorylase/glucosamine-1-phosphate N-acetyltransferase GlmU [Bdellovibrionaceae bacterium]|nr:bifunctional UDP-N-acetylglucosamine diphosphorylase/glucosamine-1-phosphate N-acetyltransferase GlmU [Bdellovibrionales bacterium]MCB9253681.1 bifunctional UDP-N-acetylglucosamine diphosphorylase/glucosamine-1-phosphate N-acetyltransferase GlmU [Pseudobdellovibrionaceae bacterium]
MAAIKPHILILAAGMGTRMKSKVSKVLHPVLYRPMLHHLLDAASALPHASINVVVGENSSAVKEACSGYKTINYIHQPSPQGTGHAVLCARETLQEKGGTVLVLNGDVILMRPETLSAFIQSHEQKHAVGSLVSAKFKQPFGYGRILRDGSGRPLAIREEKDCSETEKQVNEVNVGVYLFDTDSLFSALERVQTSNKQKEYYLTDVVEILISGSESVNAFLMPDPTEALGINDRFALAEAEEILAERVRGHWMREGVSLHHPRSITIDPRSRFGSDVEVEANCRILNTVVESGVYIEAGCRIENSTIRAGAHLKEGCYIESAEVGPESTLGPYLHLRPGTRLEAGVKLGNFVEVKNSHVGKGSKASHLSYIGDAEVGADVNIGCGFITCNYDGQKKHKTVIEDGVFVGSDSQAVAPLTIGKGAYVASGTTLTRDVPPGALAIAREKQVNKEGFVARLRPQKKKD